MYEKKHKATVVPPKINASPFGISSSRPGPQRAAPENAGSGHRFSDLRIHPSLAERIEAASGRGRALDGALRTRLEAGLGGDLGAARIHHDPAADALARSLDARAFTTGPDIFFRAGVYDPASPEGMGTLIHESAHVLQQAARPNTGPDMSVGARNDGFEQAAQQAVARFTGDVPALLSAYPSASAPMIQRQPFDEIGALPPNINPFGPTEPPPVNPVGPTEFPELPPGGVPDPLNPAFPKPPGVPNIPEPPPGGFPEAPPTPATGGATGGGILETIGGILTAIGGTLFDFFPPVPRSILPGGQTPEA